jgi:hypothetical protein
LTENREALTRTSKEEIEQEIAYYLEQAEGTDDMNINVLKYWHNYRKKCLTLPLLPDTFSAFPRQLNTRQETSFIPLKVFSIVLTQKSYFSAE